MDIARETFQRHTTPGSSPIANAGERRRPLFGRNKVDDEDEWAVAARNKLINDAIVYTEGCSCKARLMPTDANHHDYVSITNLAALVFLLPWFRLITCQVTCRL